MKQQLVKYGKKVAKKTGLNKWEPARKVWHKIKPTIPIEQDRPMVDVCFINGVDQSVPHPPRYRVTHQREQLHAAGFTTSEIFYTEVQPDHVRYANMFVIFRCPIIPQVEELIKLAKKLNKPVYFDVDDLVIDTKYTDLIPYVQSLDEDGKALYDDGVIRMGKTLKLCDGAITTTNGLAEELAHYVPEVFVNRNTASDEMRLASEEAIKLVKKCKGKQIPLDEEKNLYLPQKADGEVWIGYFSGSITHNADVDLIRPALIHVLEKYENVKLLLTGELDLPENLIPYQNRIITVPFIDWHKLPILIAAADINLGPLVDDVFNRAKSENKWVEAALVDTVTVASDVGAFHDMIRSGETGFLCKPGEWEETLEKVVENRKLRRKIAKQAHEYCEKHCVTFSNNYGLEQFVRSKLKKTALLFLPSTEISGGIMVALRHMKYLKESGYNVSILASNPSQTWMEYEGVTFPVLNLELTPVSAYFTKGIATMWTTAYPLRDYGKIQDKYYLVQNYETDFYEKNNPLRFQAEATYHMDAPMKYITISKWCREWLEEQYHKTCEYVPNGIDLSRFDYKQRVFAKSSGRKIRILIEGDSAVAYKGVDESFRITNQLDRSKYEVWYMSYNAEPKKWYKVDKFLHRVPYEKVGEVYAECDILLKSSWLESFSYPPLEMLASGGYVVAVQNGGNKEYLVHEKNCLIYEQGNLKAGVKAIERTVEDLDYRKTVNEEVPGLLESRDWNNIRGSIIDLYHD